MILPLRHRAVFAGRLAGLFSEDPAEVVGRIEADAQGDSGDGEGGGAEQMAGFVDAEFEMVLGGRHADVFAEGLSEE